MIIQHTHNIFFFLVKLFRILTRLNFYQLNNFGAFLRDRKQCTTHLCFFFEKKYYPTDFWAFFNNGCYGIRANPLETGWIDQSLLLNEQVCSIQAKQGHKRRQRKERNQHPLIEFMGLISFFIDFCLGKIFKQTIILYKFEVME